MGAGPLGGEAFAGGNKLWVILTPAGQSLDSIDSINCHEYFHKHAHREGQGERESRQMFLRYTTEFPSRSSWMELV